jgi:tetratricopeptide (TPR) repeat protein
MLRRFGYILAGVLLPGTAQVLRGRFIAGAAIALAYVGCWQVLLVGVFLLPEQFPPAALPLAAVGAGVLWVGALLWTLLGGRGPTEATLEQLDADLRAAVALILQGGYDLAEVRLREALGRRRDSVAVWAHLGWLYECSGRPRQAARAYRRALWFDVDGEFASELRRELSHPRP